MLLGMVGPRAEGLERAGRSSRRRRLCAGCKARRALFRVRGGRVQADRRHTLCFRCHRSLVDRAWARLRPVCEPWVGGSSMSGGAPGNGLEGVGW